MPVRTEQLLKAILDHAPENIVLMDLNHKVLCYNERIRQTLFLYHNRMLEVGDDYRDFVVETTMAAYLDAFVKASRGETTIIDLETIADNLRLWFHYRVSPVYAPLGELLGVSLSAENITERKLSQQGLEESEAKFRALVEQSLLGVFILQDTRFVYVNPAFEELVGIKADDLIKGYTLSNFIHDDDVDLAAEHFRLVMEGTQVNSHFVITIIRGDGAIRNFEINISLIRYSGYSALLGSALDITERLDEQIRMNEAVQEAQELERTQIGMELHDNVTQLLVGTSLNLQLLKNPLTPDQSSEKILENCLGYLKQAVDDVRQLSHRLAPAVDEDAGIKEKIANLVSRMNIDEKLQVKVTIVGDYSYFSREVQHMLYRIVQEQFSNIIKYARATYVEISLRKKSGYLIVNISDDGVGSDLSKKSGGIGLHNIRRRVQVLGGSVKMQSSPGKGFSLLASIPV